MAKATDIRPKITMACVECKERNYITRKNRRNDPDRIELKKFCPDCGKHTATARPAKVRRVAARRRAGRHLDPSFAGRTYPPTAAVPVGREKIREFADGHRRRRPGRTTTPRPPAPWATRT